jgi:hypothetical protein
MTDTALTFSSHHRHFAASTLAVMLLATGCTGTEEPAPKVDVPEVAESVPVEDFCDVYTQIHCAGALGCCAADEAPYADEAECMQASTCSATLTEMLASPSVVDGTVAYDPEAASAYLQALAGSTSLCGASEDAMLAASSSFMIGTLATGDDCSFALTDSAHVNVCAPGLACTATEDPQSGATLATCMSEVAVGGQFGDACEADEDCASNLCNAGMCEGETTELFCTAPEAEPPANWTEVSTTAAPSELRVTAHTTSNSGTTNDITLVYRNNSATYSCTITEVISDGETVACTPTQSSTTTNADYDLFYVKYTDKANSFNYSDGLRVTTLYVSYQNAPTAYTIEWFNEASGLNCEGCDIFGDGCNSCWIDGDGQGDCLEMRSPMQADTNTQCIDHS